MMKLQRNDASLASEVRRNFERAILGARTPSQLAYTVEAYLTNIGAAANGETYAQLAARLGGDELLATAERRRIELDSTAEVPWAATCTTSH